MTIPNFFIVGTPKAGTTSLYEYLQEHPQIYMSPIKETNFFSYNEIKSQGLFYNEEHVASIEAYLQQFSGAVNEIAIGEASVSYLFYPSVPQKIKYFNSEAKIIVVLRNPIDRGFSHYLMDKRLGFVSESYQKIVDKQVVGKKGLLYYQQYVELGLYYKQLKRYYDVFDASNILVLYYEDIVNNINGVVNNLYQFLEVDVTFEPDTNKQHNTFLAPKGAFIRKLYAQKKVRSLLKNIFGEAMREKVKSFFFSKERKPVLDPALKNQLIDLYKEDVHQLSVLLNKRFDHWL